MEVLALTALTPCADAYQAWLGTVVPMYIGPDQIMPLTSVLGAILGVLLMFWNRVLGAARRVWQFFTRR